MPTRSPKQARLAAVPMFAGLNSDQLGRVDRLADEVTVPPGERVARQGGRGDEFFVIESGTVAVVRDGVELALLGPGDHFGELALLGAPVRMADCVAREEATLVVLGAREFATLLLDVPSIALTLLRVVATRMQAESTTGDRSPT